MSDLGDRLRVSNKDLEKDKREAVERDATLLGIGALYDGKPLDARKLTLIYPAFPIENGPFDPDELVRWAESYGHPEEWAKRAQAAHGRAEKIEARLQQVEAGARTAQEAPLRLNALYRSSREELAKEQDRAEKAEAELSIAQEALETAADDLYKAANQFKGMNPDGKNAGIFEAKGARVEDVLARLQAKEEGT